MKGYLALVRVVGVLFFVVGCDRVRFRVGEYGYEQLHLFDLRIHTFNK